MSVAVITPPEPLVELDLAKRHLRVDTATDNDLITLAIAAAQDAIDGPGGWLQRALGPQTLEMRLESFAQEDWRYGDGYAWSGDWADDAWRAWPFGRIALRCPPLIEIVSITYEDGSGVDQVLTPSGWQLDGDGVEPAFGDVWPAGRMTANAVRIRYRAGYVDAQGAPAPPARVKQAILLMLGSLYANRESEVIDARAVVAENPAVENLLSTLRVYA